MNLILQIIFLVLLLHESYAVIYYLNASEYERMPPLYKLDNYESCLQKPSDVYCSVNFQLVSDEPNELLHMIKEYSDLSTTHYNHTNLRHGICVTKRCQDYIHNKTSVSDKRSLEGCLNQSFWNDYKLKTRIENLSCNSLSDNDINIGVGDIIMGIVVLSIILLNVIGSIYDGYFANERDGIYSILLSFSIQRNWTILISNKRITDPRLKRLKSWNGLRFILAFGVISVHCLFPYLVFAENVHDVEMLYSKLYKHVTLNSTILIQSFFVVSGFFLAYNIETGSVKQLSWSVVPKRILIRYIRLTPAYALMLLLTATWCRFLGPGPMWEATGNIMVTDCKRRWWLNLLYLNNYVYDSQCMLQSWYLAADMQLFCFGLIVCVILKHEILRKIVLASLFIIGIMLSAIHTYVRDLNPIVIFSPSDSSIFFKTDPTFNETYKMSHSNIPSYVIGISLGYFVHWWQSKDIDIEKYTNFKYLYWCIPPVIAGVLISGAVFYRQVEKDPIYIRVIYAALVKPLVGMLIAMLIVGMIFKLESLYRKFFESYIWTIPSKLSYSVFLVHFMYIIIYINMQTNLIHMSMLNFIFLTISITLISFITAIPLFVLVESPFTELLKNLIKRPNKKEKMIKSCNDDDNKNDITIL